MSKLDLITLDTADDIAQPILAHAQQNFGMIPNFFAALGMDGASLKGFLDFQTTLKEHAQLSNQQQELIALAVANYNGCQYCVSGHTFSAKKAGLTPEECVDAQEGHNQDPLNQAILNLTLNILATNGHLNDDMLKSALDSGLTNAKIMQITTLTALNTLSNWVNNIVDPAIDFPKVALVDAPQRS